MRSAAVSIRTDAGHPNEQYRPHQAWLLVAAFGRGEKRHLIKSKFSFLPEPHIRCYVMLLWDVSYDLVAKTFNQRLPFLSSFVTLTILKSHTSNRFLNSVSE